MKKDKNQLQEIQPMQENSNLSKPVRTAWNKGKKTGLIPQSAFKKGHITWNKETHIQTNTGKTHFKKGMTPWHKGKKTGLIPKSAFKKGEHSYIQTEFKKGQYIGDKNINWKGDQVGYNALHTWLRREYGIPESCEKCPIVKNIQWSNISGNYLRDRNDWQTLCVSCHVKFDRAKKERTI